MRTLTLVRCLYCLAWVTSVLASTSALSTAEPSSESEPAALPTSAPALISSAQSSSAAPIPTSTSTGSVKDAVLSAIERVAEVREERDDAQGGEERGPAEEQVAVQGEVKAEPVAVFEPATHSTNNSAATTISTEPSPTPTSDTASTSSAPLSAPSPTFSTSSSSSSSLSSTTISSSSKLSSSSPSSLSATSPSLPSATSSPAGSTVSLEPTPASTASSAPFLSFQEWRDRYIAIQDPPQLKRPKKPKADPVRQPDASTVPDAGSPAPAASGAPRPEAPSAPHNPAPAGGKRKPASGSKAAPDEERVAAEPAPSAESSGLSPIQPLANAGLGGPLDPLTALKDRSNYALNTCNAKIHRSSPKSKGASSILNEKKDHYMLTPCEAKPKFVELELCDEIQIETVVLANFEFFSGTFKHFNVKCSSEYPTKEWENLGTYRARNVRGLQVFKPTTPSNFCRYVRIEFESHYGSEFYCPLSLVRVYGYTQWEAYKKEELEKARMQAINDLLLDSADDEDDAGEVEIGFEPEPIPAVAPLESIKQAQPELASQPAIELDPLPVQSSPSTAPQPTQTTAEAPTSSASAPVQSAPSVSLSSNSPLPSDRSNTPSPTPTTRPSAPAPTSSSVEPAAVSTLVEDPQGAGVSSISDKLSSAAPLATSVANSTITAPLSSASTPSSAASSSSSSSVAPSSSSSSAASTEATVVNTRPLPRNDTATHQPRAKAPPPPAPPPVVPGESIYGTIMKRLASAERDQALAMHYIDAQSGMLRDAFERLEARLKGMEAAREAQQVLVRQATMDLARTRLELSRERGELTAEVRGLGQQVLMEKRLSIAELVGLLCVVVFVGLTRGSPGVPLMGVVGGGSRRREARRAEEKREQERGSNEVSSTEVERPRAFASPRPPRERDGIPFPRVTSTASKRHSLQAAKPNASPLAIRRHHYQPGTPSSSAAGGQYLRSPRPWTPPSRKSSIPPSLGESSSMIRRVSASRRKGASEGAGVEGDAHLSSIGLGLLSPDRAGSPSFSRVGSPSIGRGSKPRGSLKVPQRIQMNRVSSAPSEFDTEASDAPVSGSEDEADFGLGAFAREARGGAGRVQQETVPGTAGTDSAWTMSGSEREGGDERGDEEEEWLADEFMRKGKGVESGVVSESEGEGGRRGVRGVSPLEAGGEPPEEGAPPAAPEEKGVEG